jgi:hypothetical protein
MACENLTMPITMITARYIQPVVDVWRENSRQELDLTKVSKRYGAFGWTYRVAPGGSQKKLSKLGDTEVLGAKSRWRTPRGLSSKSWWSLGITGDVIKKIDPHFPPSVRMSLNILDAMKQHMNVQSVRYCVKSVSSIDRTHSQLRAIPISRTVNEAQVMGAYCGAYY